MNQDVHGNRKMSWKVASNANGGNVERCSRKRMKMGGWHYYRIKCEGFGNIILRIFIIRAGCISHAWL